MQYQQKQYFGDNEYDDTKGLLIVEVDEDNQDYRVSDNKEFGWSAPYWMPPKELNEFVEEGSLEPKGKLSDEQFEQVQDQLAAAA